MTVADARVDGVGLGDSITAGNPGWAPIPSGGSWRIPATTRAASISTGLPPPIRGSSSATAGSEANGRMRSALVSTLRWTGPTCSSFRAGSTTGDAGPREASRPSCVSDLTLPAEQAHTRSGGRKRAAPALAEAGRCTSLRCGGLGSGQVRQPRSPHARQEEPYRVGAAGRVHAMAGPGGIFVSVADATRTVSIRAIGAGQV